MLAPVAINLETKTIGIERISPAFVWLLLDDTFGHSALPQDLANTFVIRANQGPASVNFIFNNYHQSQPFWKLVPYQSNTNRITGFFIAALLIGLFFIFYRNARNANNSENDAPINLRI